MQGQAVAYGQDGEKTRAGKTLGFFQPVSLVPILCA